MLPGVPRRRSSHVIYISSVSRLCMRWNRRWKKQKKLAVEGLFPESSPLIIEYRSLTPPYSFLVSQDNSRNRPPRHPTSSLQLRARQGNSRETDVFLSFGPFGFPLRSLEVFESTILDGLQPKPRLIYFCSSGYRSSFKGTPSSSRSGLSSARYCSYWPLFSTLALMPVPGKDVNCQQLSFLILARS